MTESLWAPDPRRTSAATLSAFRSWLSARTGQPLGDYGAENDVGRASRAFAAAGVATDDRVAAIMC